MRCANNSACCGLIKICITVYQNLKRACKTQQLAAFMHLPAETMHEGVPHCCVEVRSGITRKDRLGLAC